MSCSPASREASEPPLSASQFSIAPRAAGDRRLQVVGELGEERRLHLLARPRLLGRERQPQEALALDGEAEEQRAGLGHALARAKAPGDEHARALQAHGDRQVDVGAAQIRREGRGVALPEGELRDVLAKRDARRFDPLGELSLLVGEQDGDLVAHEGLPQPVGCDAEQGLAVGVREKALRELGQRDQVPALGLEQLEAPPGQRGEPPDEEARDEEDEERGDVARVLDRERVERREEEEVEPEGREQRRQDARPALPDRGAEEDGEEQEERDGGVGQAREELEEPDRRRDDEDRGGVADPPRGALHALVILWPGLRVTG